MNKLTVDVNVVIERWRNTAEKEMRHRPEKSTGVGKSTTVIPKKRDTSAMPGLTKTTRRKVGGVDPKHGANAFTVHEQNSGIRSTISSHT
jgi:hypothetical protein